MRSPRLVLITLLLLSGSLLSACGAQPKRPTFAFLSRDPMEQAIRRSHQALDEARRAIAAPAHLPVTLRYNPGDCQCPPWEAVLYGEWQRVELEPATTRNERSMTRAAISFTGRSASSRTGWNYPIVVWSPLPNEPDVIEDSAPIPLPTPVPEVTTSEAPLH